VRLVANENYWQGRPYLDEVIIEVIWPELIVDAMLEGVIDIAALNVSSFLDMPNPTNFEYLGAFDGFISVLNFNLGHMDDDGRIVPDDNARMGDVRLRRAMAFAIDESVITENVWGGTRVPAASIVPPLHQHFHIPDFIGFNYDPERAMDYLDDAGFVMGEDGWRTDPDGNEFIIRFIAAHGSELDFITWFYADSWQAIGLQVVVERMDFAAITDMWMNEFGFQRDFFDVLIVNWLMGASPAPHTIWGHSTLNASRFMNDEFERVLDRFDAPELWDTDTMIDHMHEWQKLFYAYVPAYPMNWRVALTAVNHRVLGFDVYRRHTDGTRTQGGLHRIQLARIDAYVHED